MKIGFERIKSVWKGIRALIQMQKKQSTEQIIRKYKLVDYQNGLIIIAGAKWTTCRIRVEKTIDMAINKYQLESKNECITKSILLLGRRHYSKDLFLSTS